MGYRMKKKCLKKFIHVCPRKKKKCVIVKKKIVKVTCPPPTVRSTIHVDPTPVNVDPTPVNVNPTLSLSLSTKVCSRVPGGTFSFFSGNVGQKRDVFINSFGTATDYPATIVVTGLTGPIAKVTVTLFNLFFRPDSSFLDILLVGPDGTTNTMLMSDAGSSVINEETITFDDNAENFLTDTITSGTFKPTNFSITPPTTENLPAPAPPTSLAVALSNFIGLGPNGTWSLYVVTDNPGVSGTEGNISNWALSITTTDKEVCTFTS